MESNQAATAVAPAVNPATSENRIVKTVVFEDVRVERIYANKYQAEGTLTAELKQTVTTTSSYPKKSVTSNMQDNIFATEDFGFESETYTATENRVAWIDVPAKFDTIELVKAQLDKIPAKRLYKVLSNHPNLSDNQVAGIARQLTTKETIANSQVARYPANHPTLPGKIIVDANGKPQYRGIYFRTAIQEDLDKRTSDPNDFYTTAEITAEMNPSNAMSDGIN